MNKIHLAYKKTLWVLGIFIVVSCNLGLDWHYDASPRIEALGNDFAGVLNDPPTDIEIRNPAGLEGYRALIIQHKGHHYYWEMPLNFVFFYNHFGLALRYGGYYFFNTNPENPRNQFYRFNLSGFWSKGNFGLQYDFFIDDLSSDYALSDTNQRNENLNFHSITLGWRPTKTNGFDFRFRFGLGYYDSTNSQFIAGQQTITKQTNFFIPSSQLGVSYEKEVIDNGRLNLLLDFGGPASGFELRRLPISFPRTARRDEEGKPTPLNIFANSFSTRIASALTLKPSHALLVAFGVNDFWSGARTNESNPTVIWSNFFALPLAIEYQLTENVTLRGGVRAEYYYQYSKEQIAKTISYWWRSQNFGLGLHLAQNWYLDLTSLTNPLDIESIDLALRKEW
uniref:Uncharacterized protein n=1 Tax=candidate division WOR-3 bacterium TaxID=2052148 RepID=A0A7C6AAA0_UNCW3